MRMPNSIALVPVVLVVLGGFSTPAQAQLVERQRFATTAGSGRLLGSVAVGDVDGDPELEIVANSPEGVDVYDFDGTLICHFDTHNGQRHLQVNAPVSLADLDGDGVAEILFATGYESADNYQDTNSAYAMDGACNVLWHMGINRETYTAPDSGYQTIEGTFYYQGGYHDQLPSQTTFSPNVSALPVVDLDGDGAPEVAMAIKIRPEPVQDSNPFIDPIWGFAEWGTVGESWSGGTMVLDAQSGQRRFIYHICQLVEAGLGVGTVDPGKPGPALFVLNDSDSIAAFHLTDPHAFAGAGSLVGMFGKNQRLHSGSYHQPNVLNVADITGDGLAEVLYTTDNMGSLWQGHTTVLDHYGRIIYRRWRTVDETTGLENHWPNAAQVIPLDLGEDDPGLVVFRHTPELELLHWDGVELVARPGWPVDFGSEFPSPPAVGDVDGDGAMELVVATYDPRDLAAPGRLVVVGLDGTLEDEVSLTRGLKNPPNLYDVDRDGSLDVVVRDLADDVIVYSAPGSDPGRVAWATEYRTSTRVGGYQAPLYSARAPTHDAPLVGYRRALLRWEVSDTSELSGFTVLRRGPADPDYAAVATLPADAREHEEDMLTTGALYRYRIEAHHGAQVRVSAPLAVVPLMESNRVLNGAFERNGDCGWDKWYTGDIPWEHMQRTTDDAHGGEASMRIHLDNISGGQSSIKQWNQYGVIDAQIQVDSGRIYSFGTWIRTDLDVTSEHWIEWGSGYDKFRTDPEGDPIAGLPWPDYFSTHVRTPPGAGEWFYSNRTFTLPAGFSAVALRHRFELDGGPAQGDIYLDHVTFRQVGTEADDALVLLPFGSTWRYQAGGAPDSTWAERTFDDSAWDEGAAKFGAGSGPADVVTPWPQFTDSFYLRTSFDVDDATTIRELVAYATATDGDDAPGVSEIHLNGQQVPMQDPGLSDGAGNTVRMLDLSPFIPWLVNGTNTVAIRLDNGYQEWDDVAFDLKLKGRGTVPLVDPEVVREPPTDPWNPPSTPPGDAPGGCGCGNAGPPSPASAGLWLALLLGLLALRRRGRP